MNCESLQPECILTLLKIKHQTHLGVLRKQQSSFANSSLPASMEFKINKVPINSVRAAEDPAEPQLQNYLSIYLISNFKKLGKSHQVHLLSKARQQKYTLAGRSGTVNHPDRCLSHYPGSTQNIQNALQSFRASVVINHDKLLPQHYSFRTKLISQRSVTRIPVQKGSLS